MKIEFLRTFILGVGAVLLLPSCFKGDRVHPEMGPMVESVYGIGTVTARHTFDLKIGVTDTLGKLYVKEGDTVVQGRPLLAFSDGRVVRAPISGVVTSETYKEGETVFPQIPVLTLTDIKNPYVVLALEQSGALRVKSGQDALLSFESLRERKLTGKVTSIYPKDGQFYVNVEVNDIPPEVLVGMTADVAVIVAQKERVLKIPLVALSQGMVKVFRNGVPKNLPIKIGAIDGTWAEVLGGDLHTDDTLLIQGK